MSVRDLHQYPLIMLAEGTGTRKHFETFFADHGVVLNPQMIAATVDQVVTMVKAGLGVGFLPQSMIRGDDGVTYIELSEKLPTRSVVLITKDNRIPGHAAKKLIEEILQYHTR